MKKLLFWTSPIVMGILLGGCGSGNSPSQAETESIIETPVTADNLSKDSMNSKASATETPKPLPPGRDTTPPSGTSTKAVTNNPGTAGQNTPNQNGKSGKTPPKEKKEAPKPGSPDSGQLDSLKKSKEQLKK
jgi:hypothetical protein